MEQLLQSLQTGDVISAEIPCPRVSPGNLLVRTRTSLVSAGTERMLLDFGKANWVQKALQQPDKLRMVLAKARTDGVAPTLQSIRSKLDQPIPLGYSNAGVVLETGANVSEFRSGDRVISNGSHAEIVAVPKNLCARIPDSVSDESAAFTVVGAIALQGVRLVEPAIGEYVVVIGLGLIGLITVQLLRANGCRVLGVDFDPHKLKLAEHFGAVTVNLSAGEDSIRAAAAFSLGRGVDAVLITAATKSSGPVHDAALMCRKRGRIVLVGVTGLDLSRDDFYKKELSFQVSCSYGPGRYDSAYEQDGQDYPFHHVRWTAQRNFEAVLDMLADGRLNFEPLITHRFLFEHADDAYQLIQSSKPHVGILLQYPGETRKKSGVLSRRTIALPEFEARRSEKPKVAFIGAGQYATNILIPAFRSAAADLEVIVSNTGVSAAHTGRKYGFRKASTEPESVFCDENIDTVVIATRHDSHARYVRRALLAGKNVFVEKPLALSAQDIDGIEDAYATAIRNGNAQRLMIGFNRRFAPHVVKMKALLAEMKESKAIIVTINAGSIPSDHWTQDPLAGGGRTIGEACHFVDLVRFLTGTPVTSVQVARTKEAGEPAISSLSFSMTFADGSIGTVHYFVCGSRAFPKERVDVFCAGRILQLENFRTLRGWGWPGFHSMKLWRQDKGAENMTKAFVKCIRDNTPSPISFPEILEVSRTTLDVANL